MTVTSLGDLAQSHLLQTRNSALKQQLQTLTQEMNSQVSADIGKRLGGAYDQIAGLETSLTRLASYGTATGLAATYADAMQTALATINGKAEDLSSALIGIGSAGQTVQTATIAEEARSALGAALSALNTRVGNRNLFAGSATDSAAVAPAEDIITALETAITGQTDADGIADAIRSYFTDPSGFAATGYLGASDPASPIPIADGETASLPITALDPGILDTLTDLALASFMTTPVLVGNSAEQARLGNMAGIGLLNSSSARADLAGSVGVVQARVDAAQSRNSTESTALELARSNLISVDPYETATALLDQQTQLETLYTLTARLSNLSLVNYLS